MLAVWPNGKWRFAASFRMASGIEQSVLFGALTGDDEVTVIDGIHRSLLSDFQGIYEDRSVGFSAAILGVHESVEIRRHG